MAEEAAPAGISPQQLHVLASLKDTQMQLDVVLAKKQFNVQELYNLIPGAVLPFEQPEKDPVTLCVNHRAFAKGAVVELGGIYGFEVQEIL